MAELVLHPLHLRKLARQWILEDTPNFDYAGLVANKKNCVFNILFKSNYGILAGIPFANAIFEQLEVQAEWLCKEGDVIQSPTIIGKISGPAKHLLLAERVALNVLCRASGVATTAGEFVAKLKLQGYEKKLAGTRKTTPGFRMVEKYALLVAGVDTHRYDLSSMVMLKDNHILIHGSIAEAIKSVRSFCGFTQKIEVECQSLAEAIEAATAGCDIIMLDNFKPDDLCFCAEELKTKFPNILIEASGGITLDSILQYASPFIDIISSSCLVQGYKTVDISMKVSEVKNRGDSFQCLE